MALRVHAFRNFLEPEQVAYDEIRLHRTMPSLEQASQSTAFALAIASSEAGWTNMPDADQRTVKFALSRASYMPSVVRTDVTITRTTRSRSADAETVGPRHVPTGILRGRGRASGRAARDARLKAGQSCGE